MFRFNEAADEIQENRVEESRNQDVEVHKDMSVEELVRASEDLPTAVDDEEVENVRDTVVVVVVVVVVVDAVDDIAVVVVDDDMLLMTCC